MSLPNGFQSTRMTDATTGDQVDNKVGDLERAICDVFGIPIDVNQSNAGFLWDATGLKKIFLQDNAGNPAAAGEIVRSSTKLLFHDGAQVRLLAPQTQRSVVYGSLSAATASSSYITVQNLSVTMTIQAGSDVGIWFSGPGSA